MHEKPLCLLSPWLAEMPRSEASEMGTAKGGSWLDAGRGINCRIACRAVRHPVRGRVCGDNLYFWATPRRWLASDVTRAADIRTLFAEPLALKRPSSSASTRNSFSKGRGWSSYAFRTWGLVKKTCKTTGFWLRKQRAQSGPAPNPGRQQRGFAAPCVVTLGQRQLPRLLRSETGGAASRSSAFEVLRVSRAGVPAQVTKSA